MKDMFTLFVQELGRAEEELNLIHRASPGVDTADELRAFRRVVGCARKAQAQYVQQIEQEEAGHRRALKEALS